MLDFPGGPSGKEPTWKCRRQRRPGFDPWVWETTWRRTWQPTPAFSPGESHGRRSLAGYCPWGPRELDTIEATQHSVVLYRAVSSYTLLELYLVQPNTIAPVFYFLLEDINSFAYIHTHIYTWVCAKSVQSCPTLCDLWTVANQAPLSIGFSRQEYWSGQLFFFFLSHPDPFIVEINKIKDT